MSETGVLEPEQPQKITKRRKITIVDVRQMAELVADRTLEREACAVLGIKEDTWKQWKGRHKNLSTFEEILARITGEGIRTCMATLKEAGTRENLKTGQIDWRAHDRLLDRLDPARFAAPPSQVNVSLLVNGVPNDLIDAARDAFKRNSRPLPVVSCGVQSDPIEHKTIPEVTTPSPATDVH